MTPSSTSSISLALFLFGLIASPHDCTSFPLSRIPLESRQMTRAHHPSYRASPPLRSAVDMPMRPVEEEKEKNKKNNDDNKNKNNRNNNDDKREWKQVVGGFVPKLLRRDSADSTYPAIQLVDTLEDYKRVVVDEQDQIVVVRFFAPWCKSCKAAHPLFKKMSLEHSPSVKFVEVPLTKETAYIHEGLGVPSVPFGHIYHPEVGLVEEKKINKKVFKEFREALDSYARGSCDLPVEEGEEDDEDGFQ
ncbi:hypothetical protein ACHAXR_007198 [Thalassiosira sp. AJA248-18]